MRKFTATTSLVILIQKDKCVAYAKRYMNWNRHRSHAWFSKLSFGVTIRGVQYSSQDSTLFLKKTYHSTTILLLYVDDMIITGDDITDIKKLKTNLTKQFEMKDLGLLNYFHRLELLISLMVIFLVKVSMLKIFLLEQVLLIIRLLKLL